MKQKVTVNIDEEVYEKAHSLGINVSKACENYLRLLNQSVENTNSGPLLAPDSSGRSGMAGGEGFEPSTPNLGGWCSIRTELLAQNPSSNSLRISVVITLTFKITKSCKQAICNTVFQGEANLS